MLKQLYRYIAASLLLGIIASCSSDPIVEGPPAEGDVPVQLSGMLTRAALNGDEDGEIITTGNPLTDYFNFYLSAQTTGSPPANYFLNQLITNGGEEGDGRNKLNGKVYYPLGEQEIKLYAHTASAGKATETGTIGNITLTAGTGTANDVLLGIGTNIDGNEVSGKSTAPIKYITFKHLMTRVDVRIEVADNVVATKPTSVTMRFSRSGVNGPIVNRGTYNIFNGGNATDNASTEYGFSNITTTAQTHYLVPNGANLTTYTGQILSYLEIDDYVATADDLAPIRFPQTDKGKDFILSPGLAYDLVFKVNRLKITEIKLTLKDWNTHPGETEWGYEPKTMTLSMGGEYNGSDITKMVLKYRHTDGKVYQYIGEGKLESVANKIDFVTLPADLSAGILKADLYTKDGLLADDVTITPSGSNLNILNLGKYGMKKKGDDVLEISTPLQFALMVNDESKGEGAKYELVKDLDMNRNPVEITPTEFPANSELNGNGYDILNLNLDGNGLFTVNNGVLKNFRIASGSVKGSGSGPIGAICHTNNGTIEAVVNQADIQPASTQTIAGGISGINGPTGKILATVNTGNVLGGTTVGGIVGDNKNTATGAITACLNVGMLNKNIGDGGNLGGIAGASEPGISVVNTSFWLTGTARKNQAESGELAIGNNPANATDIHSADLAASVIRSGRVINELSDAAGPSWTFRLMENKSSWPIAIVRPAP